MRHSSLLAVFVAAFALVSETIGPADTMADAARRFLAALSPELRKSAQMALDDEDRTTWNYVPLERKGVSLKMMDDTQRRAAMSPHSSARSSSSRQPQQTHSLRTLPASGSLPRSPTLGVAVAPIGG